MERKHLTILVILSSIFGSTLGLRCHSCTSEGKKCSYTIGCHGECYKATATRNIVYANNKSLKKVITEVGCATNCTFEEEKKKACKGGTGCKLNCCSTDYCNRLTANDTGFVDLGYPNCHSCTSTTSYEDCQSGSSLSTCTYTSGTAYCYKMDYKSSYGTKKHIYKKGCVNSYAGCETLRTAYCSGGNSVDCDVYCCSGNACNAGAEKMVSVLAILSCVAVAIGVEII